MTNEECIKMLKSKLDGNTDTSYEWCECVRLAIKALESQACEDCISREEAINVVHYYFHHYLDVNDDICLDGIRTLPSVTPKAEWIPCSEKLPEEVAFYLTSIEWGDDTKGVTISWFDGMSFKAEVKAWMPLPSSYQVESEDEE